MDREKQWNFDLDGVAYRITFLLDRKSRHQKLMINGKIEALPDFMYSLDYAFRLGEHLIHFVFADGKTDLAVDGVFLDSGLPYRSLRKMTWGWAFVAIHILSLVSLFVVPAILSKSVSVWFILAFPVAIAGILTTWVANQTSFLPVRQCVRKPVALAVLSVVYCIVILCI